MKATIKPSPSTATACAMWRYNNLLCGKQICTHDEYYTSSEGEEHLTPLVIRIWAETKAGSVHYFRCGLKKAASQFVINCN